MSKYAEQLSSLMKSKGWNQPTVAKLIHMTTPVICSYLNGTYTGNMDKVDAKVSALLFRESEKSRQNDTAIPLAETPTIEQMMYVARSAHLDSDISVIYGGAGLGKTRMLKHYVSKYPDAILIETDPSYTARALLEDLCGKLDVSSRGNMHDLTERCIDKLSATGWVLLIDEAELLPYRALEVIRRIHDKAQVGVVLVGLPRLIVNLKGKRGELLQLYSRVGFALNLGNELTADDIKCIATGVIDSEDVELFNTLYKESKGNGRRLAKLLRGAIRTSELNNKPIDAATVRKFAGMLIK